MVPITIGVPVYNGADLLDESLACLARQTFGDFKVLIYDNASTDATPEIARRWADRDARFVYFRHAANVPVLANYLAVVQAADSPWFMWRADDDLSDDNYLEVLHDLATRSPGCKLAVPTVVLADWDLRPERVIEPPSDLDPDSTRDRVRTLFGGCPQWFYGLWDREAARTAFLGMLDHFYYPFASDLVTLYGPIIDGAVRTTSATRFIMRVRRAPKTKRQGRRTPFAVMWDIRRSFVRNLSRMRSERTLSPALRLALVATQPYYLRTALPSLFKVLRRGVRELLGLSGPPSASWHVQRDN